MTKRGIIDPAKVTRSAVENAASIAAMILTTEALVTDIKEKDSSAGAADARVLVKSRIGYTGAQHLGSATVSET